MLMSPSTAFNLPDDWSPDGRELLIAQTMQHGSQFELWSLPTSRAAGTVKHKIAAGPGYDLYQPHFSPNGRWIGFEGVPVPSPDSALYVVPANGGPWISIPL
jgi:Tol biopolymer transport system component